MEPGMVALLAITMVIVGIVVGVLFERIRKKPNETQGVIYAYYSDSESNPSLLLEYSVPIDDIASRKRVAFDVTVIQ